MAPHAARGAAFADFDNDGFVDLIVANNGDPPLVLHNAGGNGNHFLNFKLVGTKSNRDAIGARIRVQAGGLSQIREIAGAGSYLSQSDLGGNANHMLLSQESSLDQTVTQRELLLCRANSPNSESAACPGPPQPDRTCQLGHRERPGCGR